MQDTLKALRRTAIQKLARREHSRKELQRALRTKYPDAAGTLIETLLDELVTADYLNEHRFTEAYIRARRARGYGPLRIGLELEARSVPPELIEQFLDMDEPIWETHLEQVRQKRFGSKLPSDLTEKARQIRFLQYRGFDLGQIQKIFRNK